MKENEKKVVSKKEKKVSEVQEFETGNGLKDYKFTIILLAVIAVFTFATPLIFSGIKKLQDTNFFDNLFSKNNTSNNVQNGDDNKPNEKVNVVNADKSGASAPVLKEGMIPVRYNYIEKKWVKANSENPSTNSWYNYNNGEWANAILVRQNGTKTREYYEKANPDTIINDEDILAFYVWIPRYKYSIDAGTLTQKIDVVFEPKTATKTTGPNYITHPAFTFDGEELSGIWVGKFEVTGNINNVTVLPNQAAIVNQNISSMFNLIQVLYSDAYGLNKDTTNIRLIKNSEWGAVVYLTNSKYGICKNNECSKMASYTLDYSSDTGVTSSTTGNINGVYAMNGGSMEYVMGNNNGNAGQSGFDSVWMSENKKYYDFYSDGDMNDYNRGLSGDATKELTPFSDDKNDWNYGYSRFIDNESPWFFRDINNNIYSFSSYTGEAHYQVGFRLSLS